LKKIAYWLAILTAAIGLAACSQPQDAVNEKPPVEKPQGEDPTKPEVPTKPETPTKPAEDPSKPEEPKPEEPKDQVYQNKVFQEVVVSETADEITVTGKAQVFEGVFQYALYDGEKLVKENFYQTDGAPAWGKFEITFKKDSVTKIELFVYSAKDGSKVDTLEIPISNP
jgi:Immunoglobulin-like domain of bacterial spore germination